MDYALNKHIIHCTLFHQHSERSYIKLSDCKCWGLFCTDGRPGHPKRTHKKTHFFPLHADGWDMNMLIVQLMQSDTDGYELLGCANKLALRAD